MTAPATVDLFAGPGGWDVAASALDLDPLGVEWDEAACLTRQAAGLRTRQADVAELDPLDFAPCEILIGSPPCPTFSTAGGRSGARLEHLIVECLSDLNAGRDTRAAHREAAYELLLPDAVAEEEAKARKHRREPDPAKAARRARRDAAMSLLVVEPLRWAIALGPRLVALEQVPPVLPLWEKLAEALRLRGYQTWTGKLSSEQFGVPQTRERAFCLARLDGPVSPPSATHQRYIAARREDADLDRLFDPGPRGRIVLPEDEGLWPWVSMAEALGWGIVREWETESPARVLCGHHTPRWFYSERVGFPRRADDGAATEDGYRDRDFRDTDDPAPVLTEKARSWELVNGNQGNSTVRGADEPASTVLFGHRANEVRFVQRERSGERAEEGFDPDGSPSQALTSKARSWTLRTGDQSTAHSRDPADAVPYERGLDAPAPTLDRKVGSAWRVHDERSEDFQRGPVDPDEQPSPALRSTSRQWTRDRPAPTITGTRKSEDGMLAGRQLPPGEGRNVGGHGWPGDRPATTVAGDPRVPPPGHHGNDGTQGKDAVESSEQAAGHGAEATAVRISVPEASILQGFPPDYPWQGSRTKQFEQIGNAVPPPFAYAILRALLSEARSNVVPA